MSHNLFAHPTEATVILHDDGGFEIKDFIESQSVIDILEDMDYDVVDIREKPKRARRKIKSYRR